jgi:hypothetical protein
MNERRIYYLAIAASLTGLLILFIIPKEENDFFSVAKNCGYNEEITVKGKIIAAINKGSLSILTVADANYIPIVVFDKVNLSEVINKSVRINAKIHDYNGQKELIANEVKFFG